MSATNSVPGTIVLAGDLTGSATAPSLVPTGVIAGSHFPYKMWIDSKGRVLKLSDMTSEATVLPLINHASDVNLGIVKTVPTAKGAWKGLIVSTGGEIDAPAATGSVYGQVKADGSSVTIDDGVLNLNIPIATTSSKGLMQVGDGLKTTTGNLQLDAPDATTSSKGIMQVGTGLSVAAGVVSLEAPIATTTTKGILQVTNGNGLDLTAGILSKTPYYPNATTTTKGILQVTNGNGLNLSAGTLSYTAQVPVDATTTYTGLVQIGSNITLTGTTISIDDATTSTKGKLKVTTGSGLSLSAGILSFDMTSNVATSLVKGTMAVGTGLSVNDGTVSVDAAALPVTTTLINGIMQVGTGLSVTAGTVSISSSLPVATSSVLGAVKVGTGLSVTGGIVEPVIATASAFGVATIGSTLSVTDGVVDMPLIYVAKNVANIFTAAQCSSLYTTNAASFVQYNPVNGDHQMWTLTGNLTFTGFVSGVAGGIYTLLLKQDNTGNRSFSCPDTNIKWQGGTVPTLTPYGASYDQITFIYLSATNILAIFSPDWT